MAVIRVRPVSPGTDQYGDPVDDVERTPIPGAYVAPRSDEPPADSELAARGRVGVVVGLTLYMPADFDLRRTDRVEVDGVLYDVEGEVGRWLHPYTGWAAGATATLRRAEG